MIQRTEETLVFEGLLDVAGKVRDLLAAELIRADLVPLPFVSPPRVEGQGGYATIRYAQLYVMPEERSAAMDLMERSRARIDAWSGCV